MLNWHGDGVQVTSTLGGLVWELIMTSICNAIVAWSTFKFNRIIIVELEVFTSKTCLECTHAVPLEGWHEAWSCSFDCKSLFELILVSDLILQSSYICTQTLLCKVLGQDMKKWSCMCHAYMHCYTNSCAWLAKLALELKVTFSYNVCRSLKHLLLLPQLRKI